MSESDLFLKASPARPEKVEKPRFIGASQPGGENLGDRLAKLAVIGLGLSSLVALGLSEMGYDSSHPRLQQLDKKMALLRWGIVQGLERLERQRDVVTGSGSGAAGATGAVVGAGSGEAPAQASPPPASLAQAPSPAPSPTPPQTAPTPTGGAQGLSPAVLVPTTNGLAARSALSGEGAANVSSEPPLSATGPGSAAMWFSRLKDFRFPSEEALLSGVGMTNDNRAASSYTALRNSVLGSSAERAKSARICKKILDDDERSNALKQAPNAENLQCYFQRTQRLAVQLERDAKAREREENESDDLGIVANPMPAARPTKFPRRINSQGDWGRLVGLTYRQSIDRIRPSGERDALRLAKFALFDPNPCLTTGARSGIMRSLEDYLPSEEVFETIGALYVHQKNCLKPVDDSFEEIHFRMGLLFLERGRLEEAGSSFGFALEDREGRDVYRVLFWRGLLEALRTPRIVEADGARVPLNSYWQRLLQNHPLSFHALVADSITGYSLHKRLLAQPTPWIGVFQGSEWGAHNSAAFMFAWAIARKDDRLAAAIGKLVINSLDPAHFEQGLFFGLAQRETGFTRGAIKAMFTAVSRYGNGQFNMDVLDLLYPRFYVNELERHGNDVDLALALSLMRQESSFNPQAASVARAKGLMQVLPGTARMMLRRKNINLFDPAQNIQAGTKYLQHLLDRYDSNYVHTIASYNAGPGKVAKWKERYLTKDPLLFADLIPYRETRNYVAGLLRNIHWYRVLLNGDRHVDLISSTDTMTWTARSLVPDPAQWGIESLERPVNLVFETVPDYRK